jgi:hypothetical protein
MKIQKRVWKTWRSNDDIFLKDETRLKRFGTYIAEIEKRSVSEKEDAFLMLFASLIVQTVLEKDRLER